MQPEFDTVLTIEGHHSTKWDGMAQHAGVTAADAIPMWVADMDFVAAPCIRAALQAEIDHGVLGYFGDYRPVEQAICAWMASRHGWAVQADWIRFSHGVVAGFGTVLEAFSDPGDAIIVFSPVYHAFFKKARAKGRAIVESPLLLRDGQFAMDLDALAAGLTGREKIVVLCSPHNPGGRLWSAAEISAVAGFCAAHDLLLLSDEIHMDLAFPGARHVPTAVAAPQAAPRLVTITAASKGFNIAGGETGFVLIEDAALRAAYDKANAAIGGTPNRFGLVMTEAAFRDGGPWIDAVCAYLAENFQLWRTRIGALPGIRVMDMQSTYLSWVDFSGTGLTEAEIDRRVGVDARIAASPGGAFGIGGANHKRFNLAMPRALLREAVGRIEAAFADLQ